MAKKTTKTAKKATKKTTKKSSKKKLDALNETGKRKSDRRQKKSEAVAAATAPAVEARKVKRRRQIDPTTCEREYSDAEIEFMQAMDEYKRASGRMFPTCSEILEVLANMGYRKVADAQEIYSPDAENKSDEQSDETLDEMEKEFA